MALNGAATAALITSLQSDSTISNSVPLLIAAGLETVSIGISLTPKMSDQDDFTRAMGFVLLGKSKFER